MTSERPRFVLGSASPRRLELLSQLGIVPDAVIGPDIDETPFVRELPRAYCVRMAREKIAEVSCEGVVLCADTTVAVGRRILGKPSDRAEAGSFLRLLSGRRHKVITAIAVRSSGRLMKRVSVTSVQMRLIPDYEMDAYLDTIDWQGKAGGYAIQGRAAAFVTWIGGSYSGVMGLPLAETATLLRAGGVLK